MPHQTRKVERPTVSTTLARTFRPTVSMGRFSRNTSEIYYDGQSAAVWIPELKFTVYILPPYPYLIWRRDMEPSSGTTEGEEGWEETYAGGCSG